MTVAANRPARQVTAPVAEEEDRYWQRLDKFLFIARFCRSRALAASLIATGLVRVNRQPTEKPHSRVRPGDILTLPLPRGVVVVRVLALAARRGNATQARTLFGEMP